MGSLGFTDEYYDQHWNSIEKLSLKEEERIKLTISLIPNDVFSILDVGCGDGRITNRLIPQYGRVIGLDSSQEALRHVKAEKIFGSIDLLPFSDRSFDLILCCEALEHLPFSIYPRAIRELERVATKYILISVPNAEDRKQQFVTCPHCGCTFHPWRHVRSFNSTSLTELFKQFYLQTLQVCPQLTRIYPALLVKGAKLLKLIPEHSFPTSALCPQCGYSSLSEEVASTETNAISKGNPSVRLLSLAARVLIPTRKRGGWLIALYQRK